MIWTNEISLSTVRSFVFAIDKPFVLDGDDNCVNIMNSVLAAAQKLAHP